MEGMNDRGLWGCWWGGWGGGGGGGGLKGGRGGLRVGARGEFEGRGSEGRQGLGKGGRNE